MRQRIFFCLLLLLMLCACTRPAPAALERGETPDLWPRRTVVTETWTDLRAGREALWPVAEAETFKTRLAGLLTSVGWLMPQCRYAFTPGQYLLTVATSAGTYAAPVEITE